METNNNDTIIVPPPLESVVESVVESVIEPVIEPVIESVIEPVVETVIEPIVETVEKHVDTTTEKVINAVKTNKKSTITVLLFHLLDLKSRIEQFSVPIHPDIRICLMILLQEQPEFFTQCDISLKKIIADNKINTKDIPEILVLVSKLYIVLKNTTINLKHIDMYILIKTILHILFILHIQHHNIEDNELTNSIVNILDASIDLLKLQSSLRIPNCIERCFS